MDFSLRKATPNDLEFLFNLRNEEVVRRFSLNSELISLDTHKKWFERKMASQDSVIFIAEKDSEPIAQTRFDLVGEDTAEVSIAVAADFRGKGYGTEILKQTTRLFLDSHPNVLMVRAYIELDNAASLRSFTKAGYRLKGESNDGGKTRHFLIFPKKEFKKTP